MQRFVAIDVTAILLQLVFNSPSIVESISGSWYMYVFISWVRMYKSCLNLKVPFDATFGLNALTKSIQFSMVYFFASGN
jgi:hypothetical protein